MQKQNRFPPGPTLRSIRATGRLTCGVLDDFEPFGFRDPASGEPIGYEVDVARELARDLGVELALVPMAAARRLPMLQDGSVDVLAALMSWNPERQREMDFSGIYGKDRNYVMVLEGSGIRAASAFAHGRLGVLSGTSLAMVAKRHFPGVDLVFYEDPTGACAGLVGGAVDGIFLKATSLITLQRLHPSVDMRILPEVLLAPEAAFAVRKGEAALLASIDACLARLEVDGTGQRIFDRWLGRDSIYGLQRDFRLGARDSRRDDEAVASEPGHGT